MEMVIVRGDYSDTLLVGLCKWHLRSVGRRNTDSEISLMPSSRMDLGSGSLATLMVAIASRETRQVKSRARVDVL